MLAGRRAPPPTHVRVEVGVLPALAGGGGGVHHHQRGPGLRAHGGELGVAQSADVVDDPRSGGDRRASDRGLVGVDRDRHEANRVQLIDDALDQRHDALDLLLHRHGRTPGGGRLTADVEDVGTRGDELPGERHTLLQAPVAPTVAEGVGRGVDDAHQQRALAELEHAIDGAQAIAPHDALEPLGAGLLREALDLLARALRAPAQLAREYVGDAAHWIAHPALADLSRVSGGARRTSHALCAPAGAVPGELVRRQQPETGAAQQHVPDAARLLAARSEGDLGEQVGQTGHDRLGQLPAFCGEREHVVGGVAVAGGERSVGLLGHPLHARQIRQRRRPARAGSRACGTGASRASRSTRRSTVSLAIRRHVVSLPPVIVIIPLEVSYSSALREMSTDFFGSPLEISGRTPAYAPVRSPGPRAVAKNSLTASSR